MKNIIKGKHEPNFNCDCKECDKFFYILDEEDDSFAPEYNEEAERENDLVFEMDGW